MRKFYSILSSGIIVLVSIFFIDGCKKNAPVTMSQSIPAPTITSFSPTSDTAGGMVVITGSNFSAMASEDTVKFNHVSAVVRSATTNSLTVTVPAFSTVGLTIPINVTVNGQTVSSNSDFTLIVGPSVLGFSPRVTGIGYTVSVTGINFSLDSAGEKVMVNGYSPSFTPEGPTGLTMTFTGNSVSGKISVTVNQLTGVSTDSIVVKKLAVTTIAGTGSPGFSDGPGNMASFNDPYGMVADANGNLFIVDSYNQRIRKITPDNVVSTYAGTGGDAAGFGPQINGPKDSATFYYPAFIAIDKSGNLFVTENQNHDIREISATGLVSTLANVTYPLGIAVDSNDNVFVVDNGVNSILKITPQGVVTTFAGSGMNASIDGTGTGASFSNPVGITFDETGNLYVTDNGSNTIRKITAAGVVTTIAGSGSEGSGDGQGTLASFLSPISPVLDKAGNIYVDDAVNSKIRIITPSGYVGTLAGTQGESVISVDGVGSTVVFANPWGMTIDNNGNLYVVDSGSNMIRKIVIQ
jgi:serine/threonine protein kinase, bacterial